MSRNVVTTELVADQPVVVVIHHDEFLAKQVLGELSPKPVLVESYSVAELLSSEEVKERLAASYKILWVTSLESYLITPEDVQQTNVILTEFQHKLTLMMPVMTAYQEQFAGETPYLAEIVSLQEELILFHNSYLPSAMFIFGQDVIDPEFSGNFLYLFSQHLQKRVLLAPQVVFHPQTAQSFVKRALHYFLQPQRSSVLIRGNSVTGDSLIRTIKELYQSYHFTPVELQPVLGTAIPPIPFSVMENFVSEDLSLTVKAFVQQLPTPQGRQVVLVWKKLLPTNRQQGTQAAAESQPLTNQTVDTPQGSEIQPEISSIQSSGVPTAAAFAQALLAHPVTGQNQSEVAVESQPPEDITSGQGAETSPVTVSQTDTEQKTPRRDFNLNQEIQQVFRETHVKTKKKQTTRIKEKKKTFVKKSKKRTALFYGGLAFTGMGLGVLCLAAFFIISVRMLRNSVTDFLVSQAQADQTSQTETNRLKKMQRLNKIVAIQAETYEPVVSLPAIEEAEQLVTLSSGLSDVSDQLHQSNQLIKTLYLQLTGSDTGDAVVTAENLATQSLAAYEKLAALDEQLANPTTTLQSSDELTATIEQYSQTLEQLRSGTQILQQLKPLLQDLIGVPKKRTYALVLQNNQELRPTGGFIEAVALVTFEGGSVTSSRVMSSYEIDNLISGTVIAPDEITQYLNEEGWNFVDSNWDAHFPKSAEQMTWFLEKALNIEVDGVAAVDLYGIANILEATGPMEFPDYNETITHKNIHSTFEFHSEVALFDAKDDYRQQFFEKFVSKLLSLPPEKAGPLFSAFQKNFESQAMMISLKKADELQTFKVLGWSGALLQPNCPTPLQSQDCLVDVVSQVEANVGVNKANFDLKRSIDNSIMITATEAAHLRKITFENTAQADAWPKGSYKVFTRLYLPSSARLNSLVINGTAVPKKEIRETSEHERKIIGFYSEVPIKSSTYIEVAYSVPLPVHKSAFSYAFFEQQQPGVGATPLSVTISSNEALLPEIIAPQAEFKDNKISFFRNDIGHSFFGVKFGTSRKK